MFSEVHKSYNLGIFSCCKVIARQHNGIQVFSTYVILRKSLYTLCIISTILSKRFRSAFMGFFDSSRSYFGRERLARSLCSNSSQSSSIRLSSGLCAGQSTPSAPNLPMHVFMSKISWYVKAYRNSFIQDSFYWI